LYYQNGNALPEKRLLIVDSINDVPSPNIHPLLTEDDKLNASSNGWSESQYGDYDSYC
jgi:hypothetical protein